jgi:asparagine synthase (glutamine-hydrolysing)
MKIIINLKSGNISSTTSANYSSEDLMIFGRIDCLHDNNYEIWNPNFLVFEKYLKNLSDDKIISSMVSVEGQYLIILKKREDIYIFCDRYCIRPIYYRKVNNQIEIFDRIIENVDDLLIQKSSVLIFLLLRFIPGRQTLFNGISQIMPGECLILRKNINKIDIQISCVYPKKKIDLEDPKKTFHYLFRQGLEQRVSNISNSKKLLLPLSGGLDSRYVLFTALEIVDSSRIAAMTYGTPGTYDFEIGKKIAKLAGIKHIEYPLTKENYTTDAIINNCKDTDGQISFTTEAPIEIFQDFANHGEVILSGYVGDAIVGNKANKNANEGKKSIILKDALVKGNDPLTKYIDPSLLESSFYYDIVLKSSLNDFEYWFFINHFTKYSLHCVFKLREHFNYINPFIDYKFTDYVINLPFSLRENQKLYRKLLREKFPNFSNIPCKPYRGAPLKASFIKRFVAHQQDRVLHYCFGIDKRINKIDLFRYRNQILEPDLLRKNTESLLPFEFTEIIFKNSKYYLLLYNLKCIEIIKNYFDAKFI